MQCKNCKYKMNIGNTEETGSALCSYPESYFPVQVEDNCHYIPEKKELTCGDCARLGNDFGCAGMSEDDSAFYRDSLCSQFIDKREDAFMEILMFWKSQGMYKREKINELIDSFEKIYADLVE